MSCEEVVYPIVIVAAVLIVRFLGVAGRHARRWNGMQSAAEKQFLGSAKQLENKWHRWGGVGP